MIKEITFNKGGKGYKSGRIIIPKPYLELMDITEEENKVSINLIEDEEGNKKIIIEKA